MNNNKYPHLFRQKDVPDGFIEKIKSSGVEITEDKDKVYACAYFKSTQDYNNFKEQLTGLKKVTA